MDQPAKPKSELEGEVYYPAPEVAASAHIQEYETLYQRSLQDPQSFWAERAQELEWFEPWEKVLDDSNPPFFKWFVGGKTNIVHNALDRHLKTYRKNKLALIWEGEPSDARSYSYFALNRETVRWRKKEFVIRFLDSESGQVSEVFRKDSPAEHISLAVSPHEEWILYGEDPMDTSELMLVENFR